MMCRQLTAVAIEKRLYLCTRKHLQDLLAECMSKTNFLDGFTTKKLPKRFSQRESCTGWIGQTYIHTRTYLQKSFWAFYISSSFELITHLNIY